MSLESTGKQRFQQAYEGQPPWDIGKPQPVFVQAADQISGSILDAGCGTGDNALFFAERGHKVTGIDFLEAPIAEARKKAERRKLQATFIVMDAMALGEIPEQFDSVIDCGLFHVFSDEDRARYVTALASAVRPGRQTVPVLFQRPGTTRARSTPSVTPGTPRRLRRRLAGGVDPGSALRGPPWFGRRAVQRRWSAGPGSVSFGSRREPGDGRNVPGQS